MFGFGQKLEKAERFTKIFIRFLESKIGDALVLIGCEKTDNLKETALTTALVAAAGCMKIPISVEQAQAVAKGVIENLDKIEIAAGEKLQKELH